VTGAPSPSELRRLLQAARTIAVVGLSPKPERPSNSVARYLQRSGYRIIPVNPGHHEILGERCYPSLLAASRDAEQPIDIVDVFRRSEFAGSVVDEAIAVRPRLIWLQLGVNDAAAARRAGEAGIPIVMDQCLAVEHSRLV
jgi:predicted CoA-binding protein